VTLTEGAGSIAVAAPGTEDTVAVVDVGSSYELHDGAELDADAARVIKKLEATRRQLSSKCRTLEAQRSVGGQGTDSRHAILTLTKKIDDIDRDIALLQQGADPGSIGNDVANASVPDAPLVAAAADDAHHHTPNRVRDIAAAAADNAAAKKPTGHGDGDDDGADDDGGGGGCLGDPDDITSTCLCGTCQWCLQHERECSGANDQHTQEDVHDFEIHPAVKEDFDSEKEKRMRWSGQVNKSKKTSKPGTFAPPHHLSEAKYSAGAVHRTKMIFRHDGQQFGASCRCSTERSFF
jgi:hypothetical protein